MVVESTSGRSEFNHGIMETLKQLSQKVDEKKVVLTEEKRAGMDSNQLQAICIALVVGYIVSKIF